MNELLKFNEALQELKNKIEMSQILAEQTLESLKSLLNTIKLDEELVDEAKRQVHESQID